MSNYKKVSLLDDFEMPEITHETIKNQIVKMGKTHLIQQKNSIDSMPLDKRLEYIFVNVYSILGRYRRFINLIRSDDDFIKYIDRAIELDCLTLDTETNNSLDPLTCKLMGLCLYLPNTRPVYVPLNHCKPGTDILLKDQVSFDCVIEQFKRLKEHNTKIIYHNGKFDIRVCYNTTGIYLPIYWDTMIASQLLDENELAKLKYQYKVHVNPTIDTYNIEKLFTGLPYAWVDPEVFALYAAIDSYDTYLLYKKQKELFEKDDMCKLYKLFREVEIPTVLVTARMEDYGIAMDLNFVEKLDKKYKRLVDKYKKELYNMLLPYSSEIKYFQSIGKLDDPVNFDSALQLQIILYDILKTPAIEGEKKATDKDTLKALNTDFTKTVLNYRHYAKLISSFTEPLPKLLSKKDGRLHASFNQMGKEENNVRTGRMSSTDPNLQQIPSHEASMRLMFTATEKYCDVECRNNTYAVDEYSEVLTQDGYVSVKKLHIGDKLCVENDVYTIIKSIIKKDDKIIIEVYDEALV